MCHIIGKLKIPSSPNSSVKKPKKFIFMDDSTSTVKGSMNDMNINILLVLFSKSFCNSRLINRYIVIGFCEF